VSGFADQLVVVRGGGDIGSGVAWRLRTVGFPVVVLELERPLTIRRTVAFSSAVTLGDVTVDGVAGRRVASMPEAIECATEGVVPVLVSSDLPGDPFSIVVDARLAKRNLGTTIRHAPLVVALGPGFTAGKDCHAVVETMRGHDLGRVMWDGSAAPNTGVPGDVGGASGDRVIHASTAGKVSWKVGFGDVVNQDQILGHVDGVDVVSKIGGTMRGLIGPGPVTVGLKIADVDPRFDPTAINRISDKALSVGGGVLEAALVWLNDADR
jgi:xanthine dehydrogenase accessory factor